MPLTTDAELLRRAHDDPAAFRRLYERHAAAVHAYHLRRTGSPDAAQDLTAETFAQAWTARRRFSDRAGGSAAPWLFGALIGTGERIAVFSGYALGTALMLIAALVAWRWGVDAERVSLEGVAAPLSQRADAA